MKWISADRVEASESTILPSIYGKSYAPLGPVTTDAQTVVGADGLALAPLGERCLAIHPDTVSWAFVDESEEALLRSLIRQPQRLAELENGRGPSVSDFAHSAFRRGLLTLNGQRSVDPTIFRDSANAESGHLVELLVTERCNLACGYCLAGAARDMPSMDSDTGKRVIDLAYEMTEARHITFEFSGGEPFMRFPLLRELTDYALNHPGRGARGVTMTVQTNCTLLNEERVRWIVDHGVRVGISLDGDPASHNQSRPRLNGGESFSNVLRGLDLLQNAGVPFGALIVLNRTNVGEPRALADFLG